MTVGRIDHNDIHAGFDDRIDPLGGISTSADGSGHPQAAVFILAGSGKVFRLANVFEGD